MSNTETVEMTDPIEQSVGGKGGHLLRRAFHVSMSFIPFVYYLWYEPLVDFLNDIANLSWTKEKIVSIGIIVMAIVEGIRLKLGVTIYGQRKYEAHQVSALVWGAFGVGMTCLYAPSAGIGFAIIISLSLGDPLLGELRRKGMDENKVMLYGSLLLALVWSGSAYWSDASWWMVPLFAPLCVLAEKPRLRFIDDNATMSLIPLAVSMVFGPWL